MEQASLTDKIKDFEYIECIQHEGQILDQIITDSRRNLEPVCKSCCYELENQILQQHNNQNQNDQQQETVKFTDIKEFLFQITESKEILVNQIQEKLANEQKWFYDQSIFLEKLSQKCLQQKDLLLNKRDKFTEQILQTDQDIEQLENYIKKVINSKDHNNLHLNFNEITRYLKFDQFNNVIVAHELQQQDKKIQNYKNNIDKILQEIDELVNDTLNKENSIDLKNFDFQFQKSTFDVSQDLQEILQGSEFIGQKNGYQRIYSQIPFSTGRQEVIFSYTNLDKSQEKKHQCFVVGIRKESQKDQSLNLINVFFQKKDVARQCLLCGDNVNMLRKQIDRNQNLERSMTPVGKEKICKIVLDCSNNIFTIVEDMGGKQYNIIQKDYIQLDKENWRIYFQFTGNYQIKIIETFYFDQQQN